MDDEKPLADEVPQKYIRAALDEIDKQLALAKRTRDKDLIRSWQEKRDSEEKLKEYARQLWVLEHPGAHAYVKNKPALELLDTLRNKELDVEEFTHGFTEEERAYLQRRKSEYTNDYEFNKSSDAIMLRTTLILELHLNQQLILLQYDHEGQSKILDRVKALNELIHKQHEALKALRKQRVPDPSPPPKLPKPKPEKEEPKDPLDELAQRYFEKQAELAKLQEEMEKSKEEFLKRKRERRTQYGVDEYGEEIDDTEDFGSESSVD